MATFSKRPLSSSTNGKGVLVVATGTLGTLIHTSASGTASFDEIWLYAQNTSSASSKLTVEYGGTATEDQIEITIPGESGLVLVVPGLFLNNSLAVRAFAGSANILSIHGYVNRVT
jgi:hypothetical protein